MMESKDLVSFLRHLLSGRSDVHDVAITVDADGIDCSYEGGLAMLDDDCVFDACPSSIKTQLLEFYFSQRGLDAGLSWQISVEFAKLSAKCGMLVEQRAIEFFPSNFADQWGTYFLHVAFWGASAKYEDTLVRLMGIAPEDGRDGLFIACWNNRSPRIQTALAQAFARWIERGELDAGTGEQAALRTFLLRWRGTLSPKNLAPLEDFVRQSEFS